TSGAMGLPRAWIFKIASHPRTSWRSMDTRRSKRPGRSRAWSKMSGRLVAASSTTPEPDSKPSISTSSWLRVASRSSWPPAATAGGAGEQDALGHRRPHGQELVGRAQVVAHLGQLLDGLVHAGHVAEGDLGLPGGHPPGPGLAEGVGPARSSPAEHQEQDEQP